MQARWFERRVLSGGYMSTGILLRRWFAARTRRPARALVPALGLALILPGCAGSPLQGMPADTPITPSSSDVQTQLRAEARRLMQPLPASRPENAGAMSLGGMLDVLVNGMSEEDMTAKREAAETPQDGAGVMARRYLAARGSQASPDLAAIEADLADKARNAERFVSVARTVLTWHGQLRSGFYSGTLENADGARLSGLIERDKTVIAETYDTLSEQAAVLRAAVGRVQKRMPAEQARRVAALVRALGAAVDQLGALSGQGVKTPGALG